MRNRGNCFQTTSMAVVLVVSLIPSATSLQGQQANDTSDEARHRAECRLAHQVLTKGQPADKRGWALEKIVTCEDRGGEALAAELDRFRHVGARSEELEAVVRATDLFVDQAIAQTALSIATDPSAGDIARIQAIRVLSFQMNPGTHAPLEAFTEPRSSTVFISSSAVPIEGDRLTKNLVLQIRDRLEELADAPSASHEVRVAARNVGGQACLQARCDTAVPDEECIRRLMESDTSGTGGPAPDRHR